MYIELNSVAKFIMEIDGSTFTRIHTHTLVLAQLQQQMCIWYEQLYKYIMQFLFNLYEMSDLLLLDFIVVVVIEAQPFGCVYCAYEYACACVNAWGKQYVFLVCWFKILIVGRCIFMRLLKSA